MARSARRLLRHGRVATFVWMSAVLLAGCVVPPDGTGLDERVNSPPEIDLQSVTPASSILSVSIVGCTFRLRAQVRDKDDQDISFRLVSNNGIADTFWIEDRSFRTDPGTYFPLGERIVPSDDFPALVARMTDQIGVDTQIATLSLFVTDAPEWARDPSLSGSPQGEELGRIANDAPNDGFEPYNVVEARWTVVLTKEMGQCPP